MAGNSAELAGRKVVCSVSTPLLLCGWLNCACLRPQDFATELPHLHAHPQATTTQVHMRTCCCLPTPTPLPRQNSLPFTTKHHTAPSLQTRKRMLRPPLMHRRSKLLVGLLARGLHRVCRLVSSALDGVLRRLPQSEQILKNMELFTAICKFCLHFAHAPRAWPYAACVRPKQCAASGQQRCRTPASCQHAWKDACT